jgi:hypothetical protein
MRLLYPPEDTRVNEVHVSPEADGLDWADRVVVRTHRGPSPASAPCTRSAKGPPTLENVQSINTHSCPGQETTEYDVTTVGVRKYEDISGNLAMIRCLHTLGPSGTNLQAAAHAWFERRGTAGDVVLHASLEAAMEAAPPTGEHAIAACAVYPDLHTLVFANLTRLRMVDSFIMPTHNMVLASTSTSTPAAVSTHPAPAGLVPRGAKRRLVLSNSQAAIDCARGMSDGCITTSVAARERGLRVVRDFGPVPMVFTIHQVLDTGDDTGTAHRDI